MQIPSRFTIAIHTIIALDYFSGQSRVTSDFLAASTGVNPVIIRTVTGKLRDAGILETQRGSGGAVLAKPLEEITLYDLYKAVDSVDPDEGLFHFHEQPNPACPVGRNIHQVLDGRLAEVQRAMEDAMKKITAADVAEETRKAIKEEAG